METCFHQWVLETFYRLPFLPSFLPILSTSHPSFCHSSFIVASLNILLSFPVFFLLFLYPPSLSFLYASFLPWFFVSLFPFFLVYFHLCSRIQWVFFYCHFLLPLLVCDTKFRLPDPISLYSLFLSSFLASLCLPFLPSYCCFPLSCGSANSSNVQRTTAAHLTPLLGGRINQHGYFHPFLRLLYPLSVVSL